MAVESFLVTPLPHSVDPDEPFHVSLFVTHRLTPDGAEGALSDFPNVVDWTARLADAEVGLRGRAGGGAALTFAVTVVSTTVPERWAQVFPPDLVVRPWNTADPTDVPWRGFAAHRMQQHSLLAHAASMYSSPVAAPGVRGNALTAPLLSALGLGQFPRLRVEDLLDPELAIDDRATKWLDELSGQGLVGRGGFSADLPLTLLTTDVHCARRYYQRPEEARDYRDHPDPDAVPAPVKRLDPDFHQRASLLGDVPPLLRELGLVLDLRVDDPAALATAVELQAVLELPDLANPVGAQPRVACDTAGTAFFAVSEAGDWWGPLLKLGDEERFVVLDLDPDASALKLENYVRTVPRLLASETNGDPVTSAPHALRATGFSVARKDRAERLHDRLEGAPARTAQVVAGTSPPLTIEDITRGIRLEVWDDVSDEWHSLHRRRVDVEVEGAGPVLTDVPDTGFLQGASLTRADGPDGGLEGEPYHAHEVLAGWDGWSLAAPRPGNVIVNVDGRDEVLDAPPPDPDPVNPVATTTRVDPGTLPRLRYGRTYAFRAWAVDLAGNSAPHPVAGPPPGDGPQPQPARRGRRPAPAPRQAQPRLDPRIGEQLRHVVDGVAAERLARIARDATTVHAPQVASLATAEIRAELRSLLAPAVVGPRPDGGARGLDLHGLAVTGVADVDELVRNRLLDRRQHRVTTTRRAAIETVFAEHARSDAALLEQVAARTEPAVAASALVSAALASPVLTSTPLEVLALLADLITTPRPFLRWDPVVEPAVVPRHRYSEAESLLTLVIRSGVEGPAGEAGLDLTIVPPAAYAAAVTAELPELGLAWRADSQRHLAPPKASQLEAELFGHFDSAIGASDADAVRAALALALRESGTFFDTTVADLTNPGARLPQPEVSFHTTPTAETPAVTDPSLHTRGDPLTRGQYVVHDVDDLVVPYLPDPFATGLSMVFPDAGQHHHLFGLFAVEGLTLRYGGEWPAVEPYRLVLESGEQLHGQVDGRAIRVQVPAGEQLRFQLSSALDRERLAWLGLWRSLPAVLQGIDLLAEAAADGWFWWLTPATEIRLVHAVPRPVEVPRPTVLVPDRVSGDTSVALAGAVDLHGPSTGRLDLEATWTEWVDDVTTEGPAEVTVQAAAAHTTIAPEEDLVVVGRSDTDIPLPDATTLHVHGMVHQLGDTKHRDIDYRYRATTRYREYFDPRVVPTVDDVSVLGPVRRIDVPSTARPPKPVVRDVLPMFRWFTDAEPDQPFAQRRTRRSGLRVYLDRPWFASGNGELLGVVLGWGDPASSADHVSQWGADPVFLQEGPALRSALPLVDVVHLVGLDDRRQGGRPAGPARPLTLVDVAGQPAVLVLGYEPEYAPERRQWFADVALDPGPAFWPFVRLAVARLQPSSLGGLHLSPVVRCDIVPVPPQRTATVSRPDDRHARVVVTGPVGVPGGLGGLPGVGLSSPLGFLGALAASRTMRARLERRVEGVDSDLAWETVDAADLPVLGVDGTTVSWAGVLELPGPATVAPRQPGEDSPWRVTIEEWERLPGDPVPGADRASVQARMVYADQFLL